MTSAVFQKYRPRPGQLREVAARRLSDARALLSLGRVEHSNGAVYLAGFAVECWLKARLLERFDRLLSGVSSERMSEDERHAERLLWSHDVRGLLDAVPGVQASIEAALSRPEAARVVRRLDQAAEWTIYIRYSTQTESLQFARDRVDGIIDLKRWLA